MEQFAKILREVRKNSNTTQKEIAEHLDISVRAYQHYETGTRYPDFKGLYKIGNYFNISVDYLMGRTSKPEINQ